MESQNNAFRAEVRRRDGLSVIDLFGDIDGFADAALDAAYSEAEQLNCASGTSRPISRGDTIRRGHRRLRA